MAKIIIRDPKSGERVHELVDDVTTIGRGSASIIQIRDKESSRQHCRIEKTQDGFRLVDLGSRNGTLVNGVRVKNQTLKIGDEIKIGQYEMIFEEEVRATAEELGATVEVSPIEEKKAAPAGEPKYVLEVTEGRQRGKTLDLSSGSLTMGRHKSNAFVLDDEAASSYHAEITREATGHFITDLGSTNGTYVGGEKIVKTRLALNAEIKIGTTIMVFKNIGAPSEEDEVFGTVVLDTERLEQELAEEEAAAKVAFIKKLLGAVALVGVLGLVAWLVIAGWGGAGPRPVEGNLLANGSFEGELDERGDPSGWRTIASHATPWEVVRDPEGAKVRSGTSALMVSRSSDAALDEYMECRRREPVEIRPEKGYKLGGWIRTEGAHGVYGFRVTWMGHGDRTASDQIFLMGTHPEWRRKEKVFAPPAWATRGAIACSAYGNRGKVYFDDVYFVEVSHPGSPTAKLSQSFEGLKMEFAPSGVFEAVLGGRTAIENGELFLLGEQETRSSQEMAEAEDPRRERESSVFGGVVPEFSERERIRFKQRVRPGELGLVLEYELTCDRKLLMAGAGVRFTVAGKFGGAKPELYGESGPLELADASMRGRLEGVQEILFTSEDGRKLSVYIPGAIPVRIEPRGNRKRVEIFLPGSVEISREPTRLAFELNVGSRFERQDVDKLWKLSVRAEKDGDLIALYDALQKIEKLRDRFSEDAEKAKSKLDELNAVAEFDFVSAELTAKRLAATVPGPLRETLLGQAREKVQALKRKYASTPHEDHAGKLEVRIAEIRRGWQQAEEDRKANRLFERIRQAMEHENYELAKTWLRSLLDKYPNTAAAKRAKDLDMEGDISRRIEGERLREKDFQDLKRKLKNYLNNRMYGQALLRLESDPIFLRNRNHPKFKALFEEIKALYDAFGGP